MRYQLLYILMFWVQVGYSTDYYVSNSGSDSNDGTSVSTPFKTLAKVNTLNLMPGDRVFFRRGDTFNDSLKINNSGTISNPITYTSYGAGAKPVITGFKEVTNWVNKGGNIWESSSAVSTLPKLEIVLINGVNTPMGRYPNGAQPKYQTMTDKSFMTDVNHLNSGTNWTGAELVIFTTMYTIDRGRITSQSGSTVNYTHPPDGTMEGGNATNLRYHIQDDIRTLDQQNEWFYDKSSKKLSIYSSSMPSGVLVPTINDLVRNKTYAHYELEKYIVIEEIVFSGANHHALNMGSIDNITVKNCEFKNIGWDGIHAPYEWVVDKFNFRVENNVFDNINSNATTIEGDYKNTYIGNNTFTNIGTIIGLGQSGGMKSVAAYARGNNSIVENNRIKNTGYVGIAFGGNNTVVRNNVIDSVLVTKVDGGAIYAFTGTVWTGRVVENNIVRNSPTAAGIYLDDLVQGVNIRNNTVYRVAYGILLHGTLDITVRENIVYDCDYQIYLNDEVFEQFSNIVIKKNTFFAKRPSQVVLNLINNWDDLATSFVIDSNNYIKPISGRAPFTIMRLKEGINGIDEYYNLGFEEWQIYSGQDFNSSSKSHISTPEYSVSSVGANILPNPTLSGLWGYYADLPSNTTATLASSGELAPSINAFKITSTEQGSFNKGETVIVTEDGMPISNTKDYVFRFKTKGFKEMSARVGLRNIANWEMFSEFQYVGFNSVLKQHEVIFRKPKSGSGSPVFGLAKYNGSVFLGDLFFAEATLVSNDYMNQTKLFTNDTSVTKNIPFMGRKYKDLDGVSLVGSVTLPPYSAKILIDDSESGIPGTIKFRGNVKIRNL